MASASTSSRAKKHKVFLSFRGEDTRYSFTRYLLKALKDTGIKVSFDIKEKVEKKEEIPQALSNEIAASNLSIVVLSEGYASSKSCLAELSVIMDRKRSQGHAVLPIFYHVDPSNVPNIDGRFGTSSERQKSKKWSDDALKQWKSAFVEVSKLKGWRIEGGKFDRPQTEHIKDIVESAKQKLKTKHRVFLSLGDDTRLNFTSHLLKALEVKGISVFFDQEKVENRGQPSPELSQAIATSNLSIVVLSKDYVSSKSSSTELSAIMDCKSNYGQIVVLIFYHVDPSDVPNVDGSFKTSCYDYESNRLVKRLKVDFAETGKLKRWFIGGNRPETEYIKEIVEYVTEELTKMEIQERESSIASYSSSPPINYQVFLSFRGEDTSLNFTTHLLKTLKDKGLNVFFDEEKLERGKHISPILSQAIAASRLSIIVLSSNYASSKSCLAELSHIMECKRSYGQIVLPIFYHVDPLDVQNLGGSFKASFDDHELKGLHQVQQWKMAFTKVGTLKGWHIEGEKFDGADIEYIKHVVEYVQRNLNSMSRSITEELVGIDDKKKVILGLIEQEESRVIGLWGMGGIGKTTLAEAVYNEISPKFQSRCFLHNLREKIKNKGMISVRNELFSKLLNSKIDINTLMIGPSFIQERLNNLRAIVVLDDVDDQDHINLMGVIHFGDGSRIILTSRDRQVLKAGGADPIHEVERLDAVHSLQLFSAFAFKLLHPAAEFLDLSYKFVNYADGSPLALKVLGSKLYKKSKEEWESEVHKLKKYGEPKILDILKSNFDGLNKLEQNIFLDIACFLKGEEKDVTSKILSSIYEGAVSGIQNLIDKKLIDIDSDGLISMHDMLEEMGKYIICQESKYPGERSRLWNPEEAYQVLKENKGTELIKGIKLDMSQIDNLQLNPSVFEDMYNLTYIYFYDDSYTGLDWKQKLLTNGVDIEYIPNELRCLRWDYYPFKSLPSSFNPKNLVVLELPFGNMELLWNEDVHTDLVNLMVIDVSFCKNLRKIPNLSGAINLKSLNCSLCGSLVELPHFNDLVSLETLELSKCINLTEIPDLFRAINLKSLECSGCESLAELPCLNDLVSLETLRLSGCKNLTKVPDLFRAINLKSLHCSWFERLVELPCFNALTSLETLELIGCKNLTKIPDLSKAINLKSLEYSTCESLAELPCLNDLVSLETLRLIGCKNLTKIPDLSKAINLKSLECLRCESLAELPCLNDLVSLETLRLSWCKNLRKVPDLLRAISLKSLHCSWCESLVELPCFNALTSLETLELIGCKNLEKIPDLLGAINLKSLDCSSWKSLVELPCLSHLTFLEVLDLARCHLVKKFPELPINLLKLDISYTGIIEVPDSIEHLLKLKSLNLSGLKVKNISSNISKLKSLEKLHVVCCKGLESLPELPPHLYWLDAKGCTSLERVEFTNRNSYQSDSLGCSRIQVLLSFLNCFNLNQDSIKNIERNAMLQIQYLAQRMIRDGICQWKFVLGDRFTCCFSGNEFQHRSLNSSLNLKIAPNGHSGSRFLAFTICFLLDSFLLQQISVDRVRCIYRLTAASGEELSSECVLSVSYDHSIDHHVFILFDKDLIIKDNDYEEASFDFSVRGPDTEEYYRVKKCGVHVFYVDAESYVVSSATETMNFSNWMTDDAESIEKSDFNEMSNDESDDSFYSADVGNFE